MTSEVFLQCWHSVDLRQMRRDSGPEWSLLQLSWPEAMWSGFGWRSETSPWTWERAWITVQVFNEQLPCPGKRPLDSGEGVWSLAFKWPGFHPRHFTYGLHDIGWFTSFLALRFLPIKWYGWILCIRRYLVSCRALVVVIYFQMMVVQKLTFGKKLTEVCFSHTYL